MRKNKTSNNSKNPASSKNDGRPSENTKNETSQEIFIDFKNLNKDEYGMTKSFAR